VKFEAASDNELVIGCAVRSVLRAPRSTPLLESTSQVHPSTRKIGVMPTAAKEGTFSAPSDPCVLFPLAASGVYPKTRVWGSEPENLHCFSATTPLRIELRWGCEESSEKTAVGSGDSFKYDPFGRRIYKSSSSATSVYAYDGDNLIEETNAAGAIVARYAQSGLIDEPLAMLRSGTTSYYDADGLGSVTSLSNGAGALVQTYTYDSFGNLTASSGSLPNPFRYTGRDFDTETNLQFSRARYYDPNAGRFLSEDPMRFKAGINFYQYVKNNAANLADPYGLKVQKCCRNTQVNAFVDFFSQLFGLKHCYIKTDTVTAGMGPANNGPLPACPIFSKTAVTDHSAEAISPGDCTDVPGVDEACVNNSLKVGTPTGRWTPTNQCNSFANDVLDKCSTCKKSTFQYPHMGGFSSLDNR
jgi:RHS repeat-associated protein